MADKIPPSDDDVIDELTSIVLRLSDLVQLSTTGPSNSPSSKKIAKRLRRMGKCKEADEFETLIARAEELRSSSSDAS